MNTKAIPSVVIIGGGASGMLVSMQLMQLGRTPLKISIVNSGSSIGKGVAYQPTSENHLLNVPTGKMSVFPDDPDHFVRWLVGHSFSDIEIETLSKTYLPRKVFGEYLTSVWKEAQSSKPDYIQVEMISDRAVDVRRNKSGFVVPLRSGNELTADYVVLASGNAAPRNPAIPNGLFYQSKFYFHNPWLLSSLDGLNQNSDVLIIGNGLTMVDTTLSLNERKHKGVIHSLSPNGFGILQHRHNGIVYDGLVRELPRAKGLHPLVQLFNKHVKKVRRLGLSAEPVIDSLRPLTQSLWMSFTFDEKKKFMARLRHLWGVARHRLPIQVYDFIQKLKMEGKLKVWAGRIQNMQEVNDQVRVDFWDKKSKSSKTIFVSRVINCTGPEVDITKLNDELFKNLLGSGLVSSDKLGLGLEADPTSLQVLDDKGKIVNSFYAIGGLLRGLLWESTAIPEIRHQAKFIATGIINSELGKEK